MVAASRFFTTAKSSETGHSPPVFRRLDVAKVVGGQFDGDRSNVFLEAVQLGGPGNRNGPRLLRQIDALISRRFAIPMRCNDPRSPRLPPQTPLGD